MNKGTIGASQGHQFANLKVDKALSKLMDRVIYEDALKAKAAKKAAPIPMKRIPCKISDEQILECRSLYEREGWCLKDLVLKYQLSSEYIRKIVDYQIRGKLLLSRR